MELAEEIKKAQYDLVVLARKKNNVLSDPEIYEQSCIIDELIVEFMKKQGESCLLLNQNY